MVENAMTWSKEHGWDSVDGQDMDRTNFLFMTIENSQNRVLENGEKSGRVQQLEDLVLGWGHGCQALSRSCASLSSVVRKVQDG
jgi:hypothetical protein